MLVYYAFQILENQGVLRIEPFNPFEYLKITYT